MLPAYGRTPRGWGVTDTLDDLALEAFFGYAVSYTGVARGAYRELADQMGTDHDADEPFVECISPDRWIPDMLAIRREQRAFEAHRFTVDFEWACEQKDLFDVEKLKVLDTQRRENEGRRAEDSMRGAKPGEEDRFTDEIELVSCWVPSLGLTVILPGELDSTVGYLAEIEYDGEEEGPYDTLSFMRVPDSQLPLAPGGIVADLHKLSNEVAHAAKQQAEAQKDVLVYDLAAQKDGEAVASARSNTAVGVTSIDRIKAISMGGVAAANYQVLAWLDEQFNRKAGNPNSVGGTSKQSNTLGQDQMLFQGASAAVNYWRGKFQRFARSIIVKVAGHVWDDPVRVMRLRQVLPGNIAVGRMWTPQERVGQREHYQITCKPYGLQSDSPEAKYGRLVNFLQNVFIPLSSSVAAQGMTPNAGAILEVAGQLGDIPRADEFMQQAQPMPMPPDEAAQAGGAGGQSVTNNISMGAGRTARTPQPAQVRQELQDQEASQL